jgi:delta24-sterol reductase
VQRQVREWQVKGNGRKMCSARPSWMSISLQRLGYKDTLYNVVVDLPDVLEIDTKKMVVKVEPSVPIGRFSKDHFFKTKNQANDDLRSKKFNFKHVKK